MLSSPELKMLLPHGEPFVFVDKITEFDVSAGTIKGQKLAASNEPYFRGHFPEPMLSVMPGVLMIEALAQLSGLLIAFSWYAEHFPHFSARELLDNVMSPEIVAKDLERAKMSLASVDKAKFKGYVFPGDTLDLEVQATGKTKAFKSHTYTWFEGSVYVAGKQVSSAQFCLCGLNTV